MRSFLNSSIAIVLTLGVIVPNLAAQQSESQTADVDSAGDAEAALASESEAGRAVLLLLRGGFGRLSETSVDQRNDLVSGAVAVRWTFAPPSRLQAEVEVNAYTREYAPVSGAVTGGGALSTEEWALNVDVAYAYDVIQAAAASGWLYLGWRHLGMFNDAFGAQLTGALVGGRLEFPFLDTNAVYVFADYTYNLLSITDENDRETRSVAGRPRSDLEFGAGLDLEISRSALIGLGYEGRHLPYERSDLIVHKVVLQLGFTL